MLLIPAQTEELLSIIERNQLITVGKELGPSFFTDSDKILLDKYKVDWRDLYSPELDTTFTSFHFGLLSQAIGDLQARNITYEALKEYIKQGKYIPLTKREETVLAHIKTQKFTDIKNLGGKIFRDVNQILLNTSLKGQRDFLKQEIVNGNELKNSMREIANEISSKTGDWTRDFDRIVTYNSTSAFENGKAGMIESMSGEDDPIVYKTVYELACKHCVRLYLTGGIGTQPRLFKLSELRSNGTNIGRKVAEWKATVDPTHPYCYDDQTEVLTNKGWKLFKDLDRSEEFLSVDLESGNAEWVEAVRWIEHAYKGKMQSFFNKNFSLVTSPNHHHIIRTNSKKQLRLVEGKSLPKWSQFLKHIPNWIGTIPEYNFDNQTFNTELFTKFLAYFFSEGSAINYNKRLTLHISQSQHKYLDEIFEVCKALFGSNVIKSKDYVQIYCSKRKELWTWLQSFGKANEKRIPEQVKQSTKELINSFLHCYCQGDGSFVKGRLWDNYQCKDSRLFYTSSPLMSADLGELILKLGLTPSFKFKEPEAIFDPKRNRSYVQNQGIWIINECTGKYAHRKELTEEWIDYDGVIYDVELKKYHTLIVRRNGKVCISGNCRCNLNYLPKGYTWNPKTKKFEPPSGEPLKPKRRGIRVWISGQEFVV